jgi:hypothetical protein
LCDGRLRARRGRLKVRSRPPESALELRYLAVSTQRAPEIWEYPDSGKFGVIAEYSSPGGVQSAQFQHFGRVDESVGYWDGE